LGFWENINLMLSMPNLLTAVADDSHLNLQVIQPRKVLSTSL
jgi:hypothetical protein